MAATNPTIKNAMHQTKQNTVQKLPVELQTTRHNIQHKSIP
ncbi:MAG TPA: hypothetical protein V6D13_00160 [Halomicronema sp.]